MPFNFFDEGVDADALVSDRLTQRGGPALDCPLGGFPEGGVQRICPGQVRLVDDEDVGDLQDPRFYGLDIIAQVGHRDHQDGVGDRGDFHF